MEADNEDDLKNKADLHIAGRHTALDISRFAEFFFLQINFLAAKFIFVEIFFRRKFFCQKFILAHKFWVLINFESTYQISASNYA